MLIEDPVRLATAAGLVLAYSGLCAYSWNRARLARSSVPGASPHNVSPEINGARPTLVAFASQTGFAEALAQETAQTLALSGLAVRIAPLGSATLIDLSECAQLVVIASTCRKGDAPDNAQQFVDTVMRRRAELDRLPFLLLALGDRRYRDFCAFGRRVDDWLQASGAIPVFNRIELDGDDPVALSEWRDHLPGISAQARQQTRFPL